MIPSNYLQAAANRGQKFSNAAGNYKNAIGMSAPNKASGWTNAGGTATVGSAPTSSPYVITVTATSALAAATTIQLFFANGTLNGASGLFVGGNWYPLATSATALGAITVTSGLPNVTYQQLVVQSQQKPFTVGCTQLIAAAGTNAALQVTSPMSFTEFYADGKNVSSPLIFIYDQYQQQTTITTNTLAYTIDGNAGLLFTQQLTSVTAVTNVYLYPQTQVSITGALNGSPVVQSNSAPAYH
jgi:hypothetical protein